LIEKETKKENGIHRQCCIGLLVHKLRFSSLLCGKYIELGQVITELGMGGAGVGDRRTPKFYLGNPEGKILLKDMSLSES
jgi:hypothetical protein